MKKICTITIFLYSLMIFAQKDTINVLPNFNMIVDTDKVNTNLKEVDTPAEFEGGLENFYKQFRKELNIPNYIKKTKNVISIMFKFDILDDGSITNLDNTIVGYYAPVGKEFIVEIDKALKKLPKWIPAEKNGKKVKFRQRLTFRLNIK